MSRCKLEFSKLCLEHESALADYVSEYRSVGEARIHGYFGRSGWGHAETVDKLEKWSQGKELDGWVQNTTWFLIANGRILGNYNFRHELTEQLTLSGGNCGYSVRPAERRKGYASLMLAHAKEFGRTLGMARILLTCSVENLGSSRTIEKNGGVLQDIVSDLESDGQLARYWITL